MDRNFALEFVRVTEAAAIASSKWVGKGDSKAADQAAVTAMRERLGAVDVDGSIVIGEGERDEAPMLYIGEKVGSGQGVKVDIAVDPLEGTGVTARGGENALCVLAAAPSGSLLHAPDTYMEKIAVGPLVGSKVSLRNSVEKNLQIVAKALDKPLDELTVVILDRERHKKLIDEVRKCGSRIRLIGDGDVSGAIATALPNDEADVLLGSGGAPEGVLAAAAMKCLGGYIEGRLAFRNDGERRRAVEYGMADPDKILPLDDLAKGDDVMFVATGVTDGTFLKGVSFEPHGATRTHSVVMRAKTGTVRFVEAFHRHKHAKV
ncbi:class II fructose-bisphosphatase [Candidatus Micrarchaeota archaeon]|nr:class II fructose-bisphosphatase [Candidatus Micrarchaeota archaeon]